MVRVKFELTKDRSLLIYPDDITLFKNVGIIENTVLADYYGTKNLDKYVDTSRVITLPTITTFKDKDALDEYATQLNIDLDKRHAMTNMYNELIIKSVDKLKDLDLD